jgi:hypothetical protein
VPDNGEVGGRIYKANAAPVGSPWMWTLAFGHHEDSTTHGDARGRSGGIRKSRRRELRNFDLAWRPLIAPTGRPPKFCRAGMAKAPQLTGCIKMFRVLFLAAAAVAVAGCARSESAAEAAFRADDAKCKSYGADPGTEAYVDCRLAIDMQKGNAEAEAARQRARTRR